MTENKLNFTKETISKITPPKVKRSIYKDIKEPGLILIISYGGSKVFYLAKRIEGEYYRIKLGNFLEMTVSAAREKAIELKNQIAKGVNPVEKNPQLPELLQEIKFEQLIDRYIEDYAKHKIKRWKYIINDMKRQAHNLYDFKISDIQKNDIQKIFNNLSEKSIKVTANRFIERMNSIFNKAVEWELLDKNPALGIKKHKEKSRDRYITSEETARFFKAVAEEPSETMRDFILIALYSGARKSNVLSMRWDNINLRDETWYIPDTKNGEPQLVALSKQAMEILQRRYTQTNSEWVFPSSSSASGHLQEPKKAWKRICQKAGLKDLRLHDLRRTKGSWMAIAGASQYVIGKALNHKSPRSTAIYARLSLDPVREYTEKADNMFGKLRKA